MIEFTLKKRAAANTAPAQEQPRLLPCGHITTECAGDCTPAAEVK
jgi:hypothetical protein